MNFKICTLEEFFTLVKDIDTCSGLTNHFDKCFELRKESFKRVVAIRKVEDADPLNNNDGARWG